MLYPLVMKKNAITVICALLTLMVCMLLGIVYGVRDLDCVNTQNQVHAAVVSTLK